VRLVVVALAGAFAFGGCASAEPSSSADTSPTAGQPSPTPSDRPFATVAPPSFEPTAPLPQPTLIGEFPGPKATVPPHQPVLAGLTFDQVTRVWASLGFSCESYASGGPESAAAWHVHCEDGNPNDAVMATAELSYWTLDGIATMSVSVNPNTFDGSLDAERAAIRWVVPFADLIGGEPIVAWVHDHIGDPNCLNDCVKRIGDGRLVYSGGLRGSQGLEYYAPVPTH